MSKEAQKFYDEIDSTMEEFTEEYLRFYEEGKKVAAMPCRKALQAIIVAAKNLRKVIQSDKTGNKPKLEKKNFAKEFDKPAAKKTRKPVAKGKKKG